MPKLYTASMVGQRLIYGVLGAALWCAHTVLHAQQEVSFASVDGTVIKAWWFEVPQPKESGVMVTRRPVVIALHGCGGLYANAGARKGLLNARHQAMGQMLQAQGYHVIFPDSLTARGEDSICVQKIGTRSVTQRERRADALGALAWVRQQTWADATRVAVMGWSHGGSAVLAATDVGKPASLEAPFKTAIAFYPGCADAVRQGYQPNTSLTLFLGADDDWTPPAPCIAMAQQLQSMPTPQAQAVELHVYPGAVHDFDNPLPGVRERPNIPSRLHEGRGVMAGQNLAAREASWERVKAVLTDAFR
jgi:dienelactone hydrolase